MSTSDELYKALWASADEMRKSMTADKYQNYLLGLIFYKYLSDKYLQKVVINLSEPFTTLEAAQKLYEEAVVDPDTKEIVDYLQHDDPDTMYAVAPDLTYTALLAKANRRDFHLDDLRRAFKNIEQSDERLHGLFSSVNLSSDDLGSDETKRSALIGKLLMSLGTLNLLDKYDDIDVLGNAYEYLIKNFASESGTKAGEFYTPQPVSDLMTRLTTYGREDKKNFTIYDPTMGSASLLLKVKKHNNHPGDILYFGQEMNNATYNLARMNMMLHDVPLNSQHLSLGDTLGPDWPTQQPTNFDAVMMNPPYSAKWDASDRYQQDPRFQGYGVAPKSKADYAFLLHGFYHLKHDGRMAIVLPHGVLFRGGSEGKIRTKLLDEGAIDAVIGLPTNMFYNASIPTVILVLRKDRSTDRSVLFIDASSEFTKEKPKNVLTQAGIEHIVETWINRKDVEKYAHVAELDEIKENDYNLNIPRYVDTFEEEAPVDVQALVKEYHEVDSEIDENTQELAKLIGQLTASDPQSKKDLAAMKEMFK